MTVINYYIIRPR